MLLGQGLLFYLPAYTCEFRPAATAMFTFWKDNLVGRAWQSWSGPHQSHLCVLRMQQPCCHAGCVCMRAGGHCTVYCTLMQNAAVVAAVAGAPLWLHPCWW
jgi:hypothetical protein